MIEQLEILPSPSTLIWVKWALHPFLEELASTTLGKLTILLARGLKLE
jgi:hypothetical protein